MNRYEISCIVLAGGRGKRIRGNDKGLQPYKNKRLVEHVIEKISPQVDEIIISANRNLAEYRNLGLPVVTDNNDRFDGPLAGIANALPSCSHQWVLVVPCDMPDLPENLVTSMWQHTKHSRLITVSANNRLQLILLMHSSLLASINEFLANNQHSVMRWVDSADHYTIAMDNEAHFRNINTCDDLDT
jgi:molybdopterin-guanine dinucleotide biosynthesis protein A